MSGYIILKVGCLGSIRCNQNEDNLCISEADTVSVLCCAISVLCYVLYSLSMSSFLWRIRSVLLANNNATQMTFYGKDCWKHCGM